MKRIGWLLVVACVLFDNFAHAEITLVDSWVVGGVSETPWGSITCGLTDGVLEAGTARIVISDQGSGRIDTSSRATQVFYDLDGDGEIESSAGCEIGLFYGYAFADVIDTVALNGEWGSAAAMGTACFTSDSSEVSLYHKYERSPYGVYPFVNGRSFYIYDWETLEYVYYRDGATPDPPTEATETLTVTPGRLYVLYWSVSVGAGDGFGHAGWGRLTLEFEDVVLPSSDPDIQVSPSGHDFGGVEVGSSATMVVTLSNAGDADLSVDSLVFSPELSSFSIVSPLASPATIAPEETLDIELSFAPSSSGSLSTVLQIGSNDPDEPLVEVQLTGVGISTEPGTSEQMAEVLEFFDESVEEGTLVGEGAGRSAQNRLDALQNMLEEAGRRIDDGLYDEARAQLVDAYKKCDGQTPPPDFVTGAAVAELAERIQELIAALEG